MAGNTNSPPPVGIPVEEGLKLGRSTLAGSGRHRPPVGIPVEEGLKLLAGVAAGLLGLHLPWAFQLKKD